MASKRIAFNFPKEKKELLKEKAASINQNVSRYINSILVNWLETCKDSDMVISQTKTKVQ